MPALRFRPAIHAAVLSALALLLAGCAAGPDFRAPAAPRARAFSVSSPPSTVATAGVPGGVTQHFDTGADIPGDWWTLFHSRPLDALIGEALQNNHDLKAAQAALRVAHEDVLAQRASFLPSVSASFDASRQRQAGSLAPVPNNNAFQYNLFTPQLSIGYAPDLFGLNRRNRESLQAQEQAVRFQMIATWTTLTSNIVVTAVQEAALHEQVRAMRKLVDLERHSLAILEFKFQKGDASKLDVAAQQTQLAQTEAGLPALVKQLAATRHALAVLVGAFPDQAPAESFTLADLNLPENLPVSLPSKLVAQRPDVRQARADLHAASAAVGIAAAERLPNIQLTANAGSTALAISRVFTSGTGFWGIAASLTVPIFEGGELLHQERAAKAAYVEAAEQYRSTVLTAFQSVADTLVALDQDAKSLQAAAKAEQAAKTTLDLSQLQLRHGYIGTFELLTAEQAYQQARITLVLDEDIGFSDSEALYKGMGGGWWHLSELVDKRQ
jgi:NodT family efflux transporter outer membrane factor (OMF) lipoprotein